MLNIRELFRSFTELSVSIPQKTMVDYICANFNHFSILYYSIIMFNPYSLHSVDLVRNLEQSASYQYGYNQYKQPLYRYTNTTPPSTPRSILHFRNTNILTKHLGCVNRLAWNNDGSKLASVSDDTNLIIWTWNHQQGYETLIEDNNDFTDFNLARSSSFTGSLSSSSPSSSFSSSSSSGIGRRSDTSKVDPEAWNDIDNLPNSTNGSSSLHPMIHSTANQMFPMAQVATEHKGNVFAVRFLPHTNDRQLITAGMDGEIRLHTLSLSSLIHPSSSGTSTTNNNTTTNSSTLRSPRARVLYARSGLSPTSLGPNTSSSSPLASSSLYRGWSTQFVYEHVSCVKAVDVCADSPYIFWSASEDGTVCQFDTREFSSLTSSSSSSTTAIYNPFVTPRPVIISLRFQPNPNVRTTCVSVKHLAVSKTNPYHMMLAGGDQYLRLYDRRMLPALSRPTTASMTNDWTVYRNKQDAHTNVLRYAPLHLCRQTDLRPSQTLLLHGDEIEREHKYRQKHWSHATYVDFDTTGRYIIGTYHGDSAYVFDIAQSDSHGEVECYGDLSFVAPNGLPKGSTEDGLRLSSSSIRKDNNFIPVPSNSANEYTVSSSSSVSIDSTITVTHQPLLCASAVYYKDKGNEWFRKENYMEAITNYSKGIELALADIYCTRSSITEPTKVRNIVAEAVEVGNGTLRTDDKSTSSSIMNMTNTAGLALLYANRAQALLKRKAIGDASDAVLDCYRAVTYSPGYVKANVRLAKAIKETGQLYLGLNYARSILTKYGTQPNSTSSNTATTLSSSRSDGVLNEAEIQSILHDTEVLIKEIQEELDSRRTQDAAKEAKQKATEEAAKQRTLAKQEREAKSKADKDHRTDTSDVAIETANEESCTSSSASDESAFLSGLSETTTTKLTTTTTSSSSLSESENIHGEIVSSSSNEDTTTSSVDQSRKPSKRRKWTIQQSSGDEEEEDEDESSSKDEEISDDQSAPINQEKVPLMDTTPIPVDLSSSLPSSLSSSSFPLLSNVRVVNPHADYLMIPNTRNVPSVTNTSSFVSNNSTTTSPSVTLDPELLCYRHEVRLHGHRNIQTDIKEAVFWGEEQGWTLQAITGLLRPKSKSTEESTPSESSVISSITEGIHTGRKGYIVAGSDDGYAYIYDRATGLLVGTVAADDDVCNCVQPHPSLPLLATSGIENVIRLWSPVRPVLETDAVIPVVVSSTGTPSFASTTTERRPQRRIGRGHSGPKPSRTRILTNKETLYSMMNHNEENSSTDNTLRIPISLLRTIFQSMNRRDPEQQRRTTVTTEAATTTTTANESTDETNDENALELLRALESQENETNDDDDNEDESNTEENEDTCRTQ